MQLGIEWIGHDAYWALREFDKIAPGLSIAEQGHAWDKRRRLQSPTGHGRPWVAEVGFGRVGYNFLRGRIDYSQANSVGSRGVYVWYTLHEGQIYRVQDLVSWKRTERYYCAVRDGQIVRFTDEEAKTCLSDPSAFQSWMRHETASPGSSTTPTKST